MRNKTNREGFDSFDQLMARKLIDYRVPEDLDQEWLGIEAGLNSIKRRKAIRRWVGYGSVAVAVGIAIISGLYRGAEAPLPLPASSQAVVVQGSESAKQCEKNSKSEGDAIRMQGGNELKRGDERAHEATLTAPKLKEVPLNGIIANAGRIRQQGGGTSSKFSKPPVNNSHALQGEVRPVSVDQQAHAKFGGTGVAVEQVAQVGVVPGVSAGQSARSVVDTGRRDETAKFADVNINSNKDKVEPYADTVREVIDFAQQDKLWRALERTSPVMSSGKWLATAGFGGGFGGGVRTQSTSTGIAMRADSPGPSSPDGLLDPVAHGILSPSAHSLNTSPWGGWDDVDHSVPLSFGLTVRKNINKQWGFESGLVYTYLSSRFIWEGSWVRYSVRQHLHYVGVPVNMVWYAWNEKNWNVYLLAGGMLEKGIRASYRKREYIGEAPVLREESYSIDGVQCSVNGAVGLAYRLYKGIGIYLEPRVSYFFDNHQPVSVRTDWPMSVGVSVGFRYEF